MAEVRRLPYRAAMAAIIVLVLAHASSADAQSAAAPDSLVSAMTRAGVARIAIAALPPYAYRLPSGEPQGYLIDVSNAVLQPLGVTRLEVTTTTFDAMIPGLQARQFDFVPAGLNITGARCAVIAFSAPVTAQNDALYVRPGNPRQLTGYASVVRAAEVRLAVLTGSAQEAFALRQGIAPGQLVRVPDAQAGVAAVTGGRADAFAIGEFSIPNPSQRGVERVIDRASPLAGVGIAFRREDAAARDAFDTRLTVLRADGTLRRLYEQHGFTNWDVLATVTKPSDIAPECN